MYDNKTDSNDNKIVFHSKADHPHMCIYLHSCDLDFDPMTLILDLYLDIMKMYLPNTNEICRPRPKLEPGQDTQERFFDLDLKLMTLISELDVDILELYLRTVNEDSRSRLGKVLETEQDRHTHGQM